MTFEVHWSNGDRTELFANTMRDLDDFVGEQFALGADVDLRLNGERPVLIIDETPSPAQRPN